VDELTKAREALDTALLARSNLMAQWRAFLTMSLERFRQYTDHFQQQEQAHQENIKTAKETLQKAKADFNSKEEEATVISDEDTESKDVSTKESAHKILEGLCHMTDSLQKLSEQAEKEHTAEEERKAKRPRQKDTDVVDAAMSSGGLPSMQPFGAPGHWMTLEYFDRWAPWPSSHIHAGVAGMQWSHSILQDPSYKSPWNASEEAMQLAFDLHPASFLTQCECRDWGFSSSHRRSRKNLRVCFDPVVQVHFGLESSPFWATRSVVIDEVSLRGFLPKCSTSSQSLCNEFIECSHLLHRSSTRPLQHRPDLTENPNLPDPPSSSEDFHGRAGPHRVPLRHLPAWVETLWNILQDEGATELLEEGSVIYLSTYYLSHRNCVRQAASRPIRLTRRYEEWIEEFKQVWGDLFDRYADFNLFLVQPEPPISITRGIVGIVLIVQHAQPEGAAILTTALFDELPEPRTIEIAHVLDIWTDYTTVLHRADAFEACVEAQRQGLRPCVVRAGQHVFPRERPLRMIDGLGIVVDVPMIINEEAWNIYVRPRIEDWPEFVPQPPPRHEEVDDQVTFMARRPHARGPSSSSSSRSYSGTDASSASGAPSMRSVAWSRTVVFTLDGTSFSCHLPDEPGPEQLRSIELALSLSLLVTCWLLSLCLRDLKILLPWS
jgi:hypothetical protein